MQPCLVGIPSIGREEKQSLILVATALMEKLESRFDSWQERDLYTQLKLWEVTVIDTAGLDTENAIHSHYSWET